MVKSIKIYSIVITEEFLDTWEKFRVYANRDGKKIFNNLKAYKNSLPKEEQDSFKLPNNKSNCYISLFIRKMFEQYVEKQDQLKLKELKTNETIASNNS